MIFGIDLGTTNSLIGIGDQLLTSLVSSNVDMRTREQVERDFMSDTVAASYKTNMGMGAEGELSVECSSIILKRLAELGTRRYGEEVKDVIISVPAYFSTSQREAVYKAAGLAGLNVKGLLNEPTAAALYVCKDLKDLIVVYDLGGGTFDVSIVDSRAGVYSVIATDGTILGGDNLDTELAARVVSYCKIPVRLRSKLNMKKLKSRIRCAKEEIQKTNTSAKIDLRDIGVDTTYVLTVNEYINALLSVFGSTITMTNYLVAKSISMAEKPKIVFVGGSAMCPYLREEVLKETGLEEVTTNVDKDLLVAKGVALYADMFQKGEVNSSVEDVTKRLCIKEVNGKSVTVIEANTMVPCKSSITVRNNKTDRYLNLRLYQGDSIIAENNAYIGTLVYDYGREVEAKEGVVEVFVEVQRDGVIKLSALESIYFDMEPMSIELLSR